jgi:hypothetical protein
MLRIGFCVAHSPSADGTRMTFQHFFLMLFLIHISNSPSNNRMKPMRDSAFISVVSHQSRMAYAERYTAKCYIVPPEQAIPVRAHFLYFRQ